MSKLIPLSKGKFAIVDDSDYPVLSLHKWYAQKGRTTWYACRQRGILMHRSIMNLNNGFVVDHLDGNGLNNQKENLRTCRQFENIRYQRLSSYNTVGLKGVTHEKDRRGDKKYIKAYITNKNKVLYIGRFNSEIDAAKAYDNKAIELFGEFALTNKMLGLL